MIGETLGSYRITAKLGAGGMGEVYRVLDTKLDREVAIKILPAALAQDPERLARFDREAKVLASLNHPNIAQIYGIEDRALIMELVDGQTVQGPFPLETGLNYAKQIADALEAAQEKGIVHRDLKPANIMITPAGVVKVLDFGLAAVAQPSDPSDPGNSPTLTIFPTRTGMILVNPPRARSRTRSTYGRARFYRRPAGADVVSLPYPTAHGFRLQGAAALLVKKSWSTQGPKALISIDSVA